MILLTNHIVNVRRWWCCSLAVIMYVIRITNRAGWGPSLLLIIVLIVIKSPSNLRCWPRSLRSIPLVIIVLRRHIFWWFLCNFWLSIVCWHSYKISCTDFHTIRIIRGLITSLLRCVSCARCSLRSTISTFNHLVVFARSMEYILETLSMISVTYNIWIYSSIRKSRLLFHIRVLISFPLLIR